MDVDELLDLLKEFEGKWCRVYFDDGSKTILKILKASSNVFYAKAYLELRSL